MVHQARQTHPATAPTARDCQIGTPEVPVSDRYAHSDGRVCCDEGGRWRVVTNPRWGSPVGSWCLRYHSPLHFPRKDAAQQLRDYAEADAAVTEQLLERLGPWVEDETPENAEDEPLADWERELPTVGEAVEGDGHGNAWDAHGNQVEHETVTAEAERHVYGDRNDDYGHPREDFTTQAILWTGLLRHKLADGEHITPEDIGRCMVGVKLARDVNHPKRDNRVDGAGYFLTLDRLETGR